MQPSDLISIIGFAAGPALLTIMAAFLGWLYRHFMWRTDARKRPEPQRQASEALNISAIQAGAVASASHGSAAETREVAAHVSGQVGWAHVWAWLAYATVVSTIVIAFGCIFPWSRHVAITYGFLSPQILILFWAIRLPPWRRLLIFVLYAVIGVVFAVSFSKQPWTGKVLHSMTILSLIPIPGLLILFFRRNRPFLVLLIAIAVYFMGTGVVLGRFRYSLTEVTGPEILRRPDLIFMGLVTFTAGVMVAWLLLRQPRKSLIWVVVFAGVIAAVLLDRDVADQKLPVVVRSLCFIVVAVLQNLIIWAMFKGLVWLAERRFLTLELVHVHVCWAFLTMYLVITTLFGRLYCDNTMPRWGFIGAHVLFIAILHLLLFRIYKGRPPTTERRLLLLRVFGRPNESEGLLDDLNDTWRRIGAVDLLASSDVASRTLETRMLELFLLRRSVDEFLRTDEAIYERADQRRSMIQADARYPVDAFFCHDDVWRTAVDRLANTPDIVIMMDLRGFTTSNDGCVRELRFLLQRSLKRVVFIVDSRTHLATIDGLWREAGAKEKPTLLLFEKRSNEERRALFELLLKAAYA